MHFLAPPGDIDMNSARRITVIGVASGAGAADPGCAEGPAVLHGQGFLRDLETVEDGALTWAETVQAPADAPAHPVEAVAEVAAALSAQVEREVRKGDFPLVVGGDHSIAIGTWSGVHAALAPDQRLGLLWLDAHMDSHTFRTTPSNAIHGMPLACLLGYGDPRLTRVGGPAPKLRAEDVCLIGVRSFEWGEAALLKNLGVRIYFMPEIRERGLDVVVAEAIDRVSRETVGYGISFDLDVFDPTEEPGTGTPVPGGLHKREMLAALRRCHDDARLLAMEIVEYNPSRDPGRETARAVHDLCLTLA